MAQRVLAIGDTHDSPELDKDRFRWFGRLARDLRVNQVVQIGDMFTFDSLCKYADNASHEGKLKPEFLDDLASGEEALEQFNKGLGPYKCKKHITIGNHEARIYSYEDRNPEVWGLMRRDYYKVLKKGGWGWTDFGDFYMVDGVGFTHVPINRMGRPYGGKNAENQVANDAIFDVVFGHSHIEKVVTTPKIGPNKRIKVINLGSGMPNGHVEPYAKHGTTGWTYGAYELLIKSKQIVSQKFYCMEELEDRYG